MTKKSKDPADDTGKISTSPASDQTWDGSELPSCGDFDIRIARDGTWFYRNSPIGRKALVRLFSSVLRREADGTYWMVTPVERGQVEVEDAPFTAVELSVTGQGPAQILRFRTSVDDWIEAGQENPIRVAIAPDTCEPRPYILVRAGLEALILRPVYYHLADLAVEHDANGAITHGVWSNKVFFPLVCPD
jgi:uncharacterized protein